VIAIGAFSPLTGFMEQEDYDRVLLKYAAEKWSAVVDSTTFCKK